MKVILGLGAVLTVCLFLPAPFLSRLGGYFGIISSQAISDVISAAIAVFLYVRLMRQDKS